MDWQVGQLRGSQVYRTGKEITAAAQASAAQLRPLIDRAETDGLIQQASTPAGTGRLTIPEQFCSGHLETLIIFISLKRFT
jgi:hypothetical protein